LFVRPFLIQKNMACDLTLGFLEACKDKVGGINNIYLINYDDLVIGDVGYNATDTDVITTLGADVPAFKYELKAATNTFEQTVNSSRDNGTTFFEQTLNIVLKGMSKEKNKELKLLAYGRPVVLIEDNNGNLLLAGLEHGMDVSGGTFATGGAMGDLNGYSLTLSGMEKVPANFCIPTTGTTVAEKLSNLGLDVTVGV
jgi:hypothetical protein